MQNRYLAKTKPDQDSRNSAFLFEVPFFPCFTQRNFTSSRNQCEGYERYDFFLSFAMLVLDIVLDYFTLLILFDLKPVKIKPNHFKYVPYTVIQSWNNQLACLSLLIVPFGKPYMALMFVATVRYEKIIVKTWDSRDL